MWIKATIKIKNEQKITLLKKEPIPGHRELLLHLPFSSLEAFTSCRTSCFFFFFLGLLSSSDSSSSKDVEEGS